MKDYLLYTFRGIAGCMMLAAMTAACTQDDSTAEPGTDSGIPKSYVSLSFVAQGNTGTRANPTGGEDGDGHEAGQGYENNITSAVAFFFKGNGTDGVNSPGITRITDVVAFNSLTLSDGSGSIDRIYETDAEQCELENGTYNVLVVANTGNDWWTAYGSSLTLANVRDHLQTTAWTETGSGYDNFVMSSAADATIELNSNPKDNPATAEVGVERMAARIDYKADERFTCDDPQYIDGTDKPTVEITGAAMVNNLTAGSYLLKRVADDVTGTNTEYLGDETADATTGAGTNYVLDPWTAQKTETNDNFTVGTDTKTASGLYGTWFGSGSEDPNWWADYVQAGTDVSDGTVTWKRIGYTMENTTAADETGSRYNTGVVFKAKFHPVGIKNYTDGSTFFALGSQLFASMEDMMGNIYGETNFADFDSKIDNCSSWEDLETQVIVLLLDNDPSGYKVFLAGQDKTKTFADVKASLKWKNYMLNECGYSAEKGTDANYTVTIDQNSKVTRIALKEHNVRTYEDATCYYTWWVRHANDGNDGTNGIMEYAIVRNNIYKLEVESVYSLGGDVPGDDEGLVLDAYVKDWNLLKEEELPM